MRKDRGGGGLHNEKDDVLQRWAVNQIKLNMKQEHATAEDELDIEKAEVAE